MRGLDTSRVPLTALAVRVRRGVAIFTGALAFAPSLVVLVGSREVTSPLQIVAWSACCALWVLAWVGNRHRALTLPLPIALYMTLVVFLPVPEGFEWPRLAGIALSLAVTAAAVSGLRWTLVWSVYAACLLTLDYVRPAPHAGHLSSSTLDAVATLLGVLVIPAAIAVVSQRWGLACQDADATSESTREREAQALAAERAESARAAVDRRIHETVLNTLATIGRAKTSDAGAREQCAHDLEALDSLEVGAPRSVAAMLDRLLEQFPVPNPHTVLTDPTIAFGDDALAGIAYAAVGEVMRNVTRHADACNTTIRVQLRGDVVVFAVTDDGTGMDDNARQRFGIRRALRESVESANGSVTIFSTPGQGTTVTVTLPATRIVPPPPSSATSSIDVLLGPVSVRTAMASVLVIGLGLLLPTSLAFAQPFIIASSYLVFAALVVVIARRWATPRLAPLAWVCLTALVAVQVAAWVGVEGCGSAGGMHVVVFCTAGAMLIPPLALRSLVLTLTMVALVIVPTLVVPWGLPAECRTEALVPAMETSLWVLALVGLIAVLSRAFDRATIRLRARWQEIADADARVLAMQAADQRWRSVDAETRTLLSSVANELVSPDAPAVRASALRLEARLRSLLETSSIRPQHLRACLEDVVEDVTRSGVAVTVVVVSDDSDGRIDPGLVSRLTQIGEHSRRSGLHLTLLDGEILVSADRDALETAGFEDLGETEAADTAVAVIRWAAKPVEILP